MATQLPAFQPVNEQLTAQATVTTVDENFNRIQAVLADLQTRYNAFVTEFNGSGVASLEQVQDVVAAMFTGGTHNGISYNYDDVAGVINSTVTGIQPPLGTVGAVNRFTINLPSIITPGTDINNERTINFGVVNASDIASLTLVVNAGDDKTLTVPSSDGFATQSVTLTGIDTASPGTVTFQIRGLLQDSTPIMSNSVTVTIRATATNEFAYYGTSTTNNPDTVDISGLTSTDVTPPGQTYDIDLTLNANEFLIILEPSDRVITSILERRFNQESINNFTRTTSVRTISGTTYNAYVLPNNGPTGTVAFRVTHG